MITAQALAAQPRWQRLWRFAMSDPREQLRLLGLPDLAAALSDAAAEQFPLRLPRGFVARMRRVDPRDRLLRQVLPVALIAGLPGYPVPCLVREMLANPGKRCCKLSP